MGGGGGGVVVRCRGFIEENSPDFRFPEVGISGIIMVPRETGKNAYAKFGGTNKE